MCKRGGGDGGDDRGGWGRGVKVMVVCVFVFKSTVWTFRKLLYLLLERSDILGVGRSTCFMLFSVGLPKPPVSCLLCVKHS